jgi:hypothetical protein
LVTVVDKSCLKIRIGTERFLCRHFVNLILGLQKVLLIVQFEQVFVEILPFLLSDVETQFTSVD